MEQDSCPVVLEVAQATSVGLDQLNGAVEAFRSRVARQFAVKRPSSDSVAS